jgi:hypothetical protein
MAVPEATIAANFHKAFDVKVNLFSQLPLNAIFPVNNLPQAINLLFGKSVRLNLSINISLS